MCCRRLVCERISMNLIVAGSFVLSRCRLKSPVIANSWDIVAADSRKEVKSSMNLFREAEYFEDEGGR